MLKLRAHGDLLRKRPGKSMTLKCSFCGPDISILRMSCEKEAIPSSKAVPVAGTPMISEAFCRSDRCFSSTED